MVHSCFPSLDVSGQLLDMQDGRRSQPREPDSVGKRLSRYISLDFQQEYECEKYIVAGA